MPASGSHACAGLDQQACGQHQRQRGHGQGRTFDARCAPGGCAAPAPPRIPRQTTKAGQPIRARSSAAAPTSATVASPASRPARDSAAQRTRAQTSSALGIAASEPVTAAAGERVVELARCFRAAEDSTVGVGNRAKPRGQHGHGQTGQHRSGRHNRGQHVDAPTQCAAQGTPARRIRTPPRPRRMPNAPCRSPGSTPR